MVPGNIFTDKKENPSSDKVIIKIEVTMVRVNNNKKNTLFFK